MGNFTNCVVLRQSANTGDQMVGQVYGSPTLTTNATVPAGATLLIPAGSTLTVATGTTLTNSGATVTVGGTVLTVNGSTADATGSAELAFTLVAGQTEKYSGTYKGTVTFTVSVEAITTP